MEKKIFIESQTVDLKEKVIDAIKKERIAFAKRDGGTRYVGITDVVAFIIVHEPFRFTWHPPLIVTREQLTFAFQLLEEAIKKPLS